MKVKDLNHSSEKTKKLIRNTFVELIEKNKELNKITVSELVKKADINRGTFYNHYDSIYDVAEEFESEIIKILLKDNKNLTSIEDIFKYFDNVTNYLKENEHTYKLLLSSKEPLTFLVKLNNDISNKLYNALSNNPNLAKSKTLKFDISFFTDGIINQVLRYFNASSNYSLDDINTFIKKLFRTIFDV